MWDIAATTIFVLFGMILSLDSFLKWRRTRHVLFFVAGVLGAITALAFIISWGCGAGAAGAAMITRVIAGIAASWSAGRRAEENPPD